VRPFGKTRAAAEYAALHARAELTRVRATALLQALAACETALADGNGRPPVGVSAALLRRLVTAVRDLAGPAWLDASADDPDVAAFTALQATVSPPDPGVADETCSRVLWARFSPAGAHREGTGNT
jgi:hypothetical protein